MFWKKNLKKNILTGVDPLNLPLGTQPPRCAVLGFRAVVHYVEATGKDRLINNSGSITMLHQLAKNITIDNVCKLNQSMMLSG